MEEFSKKCNEFETFLKSRNFYMDSEDLKTVLVSIELGYPIMAKGPTGSGKTEFFSLLAEFLGASYHYQSLNGSVHIEDLTQERIITDKGVQDQDMILPTWLRASVKKPALLHLDEVNAAKPETLLALHSVIDIKKELFLPFSKERLAVTKKALIVASCNEGDAYTGTNVMNLAFLNRWVTIHFSYLNPKDMCNMLIAKTGVESKKAEAVVNVWNKYMGSREPHQPAISPRILLMWLNMSKTLGLKTAGKNTFASLVAEDKEQLIQYVEGDLFVGLGDL